MSSNSFRPNDCYSARFDPSNAPTNVDVDGIAVIVANVIITFCLRILITWSPESIDEEIQTTLLQVHSVLFSTLLSINRQQLSLYDANFALAITSSPLTIYLIFSSICYLFRIENGLYKRIKSHPLIISVLGTSILGLWLALSMTLDLSDSAFIDSELCRDSTFKGWLKNALFVVLSGIFGLGPKTFLFLPFGIMWLVVLIRERTGIIAQVRSRLNGKSKPWLWFCAPWVAVKCVWRVVNADQHRWCFYAVFLLFDTFWYYSVSLSAPGLGGGYVLSYGQILSLFTTILPLKSTLDFMLSVDRVRVHHHMELYRADLRYLATGDKSKLLALSGPLPLAHPISTSTQSAAFPDVVLQPSTNNPDESPAEEDRQPQNSTIGSPRENLCSACNQRRDVSTNQPNSSTTGASIAARRAAVPTFRHATY